MWVLARHDRDRLVPVQCPVGRTVCSSQRNGYRCPHLSKDKTENAFVYCRALLKQKAGGEIKAEAEIDCVPGSLYVNLSGHRRLRFDPQTCTWHIESKQDNEQA